MDDPVEVPPDHYVMVGKSRYSANVDEWVGSQLERGERVWCRQKPLLGAIREFPGVVRSSYFYDGVILSVWDLTCIDQPTEESLFLDHRDAVWPERGVVMVAASDG